MHMIMYVYVYVLIDYRGNTVLFKLFIDLLHEHPLLIPYDRDRLPMDQLPWSDALDA